MLKVRCQAQATLDAKGRLALPAQLRRALEKHDVDSLVLTFFQGAIWAWDAEVFERTVEAPLLERDRFNPEVMAFTHALLAPAQDVDVDNAGRIRIPPLLRELADLEREVVVNSVLDRIEIWDREAWEQRFKSSLERARGLPGMPMG